MLYPLFRPPLPAGTRPWSVFLSCLLVLLLLTGCSSPEEKANRFYQTGMQLLDQGNLVKAELELRNALQLQPNMTEAWYGLTLVAEKQQKWKDAFGHLNRILELNPEHRNARVKHGRLLLIAGQTDKALETSQRLMEDLPEEPDVLALHAAVLLKLDNLQRARELANAALQKSPAQADALAVLAMERLRSENPDAAIRLADQGIAKHPQNIPLHLIKVQAYEQLGRPRDVEQVFLKLVDQNPQRRVLRQALARFYLDQNRPEDAENEFRTISADNPEDFSAKMDLIRLISETRGLAGAIEETRDLIKQFPNDEELQFVLATLYKQQGSDKLEPLLKKLQASESVATRARALSMQAELRLTTGDVNGGRQIIEDTLKLDPRNERALQLKASLAMDAQQFEEAIAILRNVLKDHPQSPSTMLLLARAHARDGQKTLTDYYYSEAVKAVDFAPRYGLEYAQHLVKSDKLERARNVLEDVLENSPGHPDALKQLAKIQIALGALGEAQATTDKLRDQQPAAADQLTGEIEAGRKNYSASIAALQRAYGVVSRQGTLISLVKTYLQAGRVDEALTFLQNVLSANPRNTDARLLLGRLQMVSGDLDAAEASLHEVLKLVPDSAEVYLSLSQLHAIQRAPEQAMQAVELGLKKIPDNFQLRMAKASLLERQGDYQTAISLYRDLLAARPSADIVANNLANLLANHGQTQADLQQANQLARRFEGSTVAHFRDTLGWTYLKVDAAEKAIPHLQAAADSMPSEPVFRYHLGLALIAADRKEAAREHLQKSLALLENRDPPYRGQLEAALAEL